MTVILFSDTKTQWEIWRPHLEEAFAELGLTPELTHDHARTDITHIALAPSGFIEDYRQFPQLQAVFSTWAGVEKVVGNPTLTVPLTHMVEPGLGMGMSEYVLGHVMRYHLGIDAFLAEQSGNWRSDLVAPLAEERGVCVLGLGALGTAAAELLGAVGFDVYGWSRSAKRVLGTTTYHGENGFSHALASSTIFVTLLPQTAATQNLINADVLAQMPKGSCIINPGRGPLIDDDALIAALDSGHIAHATLDVFREEPLAQNHPYWAHPKVTVTPHIAAATRPATASRMIAENLRRSLAGEPLLHVVDRTRGY